MQQFAQGVHVDDAMIAYIVELVRRTRDDKAIELGASPRASIALLKSAQVIAASEGRTFLTPDDVKPMVAAVLRHRVMLHPDAQLPTYAHGPLEDAGMDVRSVETCVLEPWEPQTLGTGLALEIPPGFEVQVRPRSGLALKHAITLPNAPATIDPGYRGELRVILLNLGREPYRIHPGDRIAQMIVARYEAVEWAEESLTVSVRGEGGFGSSGA